MTTMWRAWCFVIVVCATMWTSRVAWAASEFQCADGRPNVSSARCDCPAGKHEITRDDISHCVPDPPIPPQGGVGACGAGMAKVGGACVRCPLGTHAAGSQCALDVKPKGTSPERYCLVDPKGNSLGCFAESKVCGAAEADYAQKQQNPPHCQRRDEVACFVQSTGIETCELTLDACHEKMFEAGRYTKNVRDCAIQNAQVGIPTNVPRWVPPNARYCPTDASGRPYTHLGCSLFRDECEAWPQLGSLHLTCQLTDPVYCLDAFNGESCYGSRDGCKIVQDAYTKGNLKVFAGCGAQGTGNKERGATQSAPTTAQTCIYLDSNENACFDYRAQCEDYARSAHERQLTAECRDVSSKYCFEADKDRLECHSSLADCKAYEWLAEKREAPPIGGCSEETAGQPHAHVPIDPIALDRYCLVQKIAGHDTYGCDFLTLGACEQAAAALLRTPMVRFPMACEHHPAVACYTHTVLMGKQQESCAATMKACEERTSSPAIRLVTPCALQGTPGTIEAFVIPGAQPHDPPPSVSTKPGGCGCHVVGSPTDTRGLVVAGLGVFVMVLSRGARARGTRPCGRARCRRRREGLHRRRTPPRTRGAGAASQQCRCAERERPSSPRRRNVRRSC